MSSRNVVAWGLGVLNEIELRLATFKEDQPRDQFGRWVDTGPTEFPENAIDPKTGRPIPIKVDSVEDAVKLILKGRVVELPEVRKVNTVLNRLASMAKDAKEKGEQAPNYDLCQVSVPGTNLFCADKLRTTEFPDGVPRIKMPQLGGKPLPGTEADKLPRNPWDPSEVDGAAKFIEHLERDLGITTERGVVPAAKLKASQAELVGAKVASMMIDRSFDPAKNPVFVSRDNYVVDGHHRWAAVVGRDAEDGVLGDHMMNIVRVDAPISEVLKIANDWADKFGITPAAGVKKRAAMLAVLEGLFELRKIEQRRAAGFDPSQERDESGKWTDGSGGSSQEKAREQEEQRQEDKAEFYRLKRDWARVNNELLNMMDTPDSPEANQKLDELNGLVKQMYQLDADPGGLEGIGLPGGPRDVAIIGAGPGGLAAAVMGGTDGLDTVFIDANETPGGQARMSSRIENYPGFPVGVTGEDLASSMFEQAQRVGAEAKLGVRVTGLEHDESTGMKRLTLSNGETIEARSVILAGGVEFRQLEFPGSDSPDVVVGDGKRLAELSMGGRSTVVGGSNGAAQAALGVARHAEHVTLISRSPIEKSMSDYQVQAIRNHPRITVIEGDEISRLITNDKGRGEAVELRSGRRVDSNTLGLFLGGAPSTNWLPPAIQRSGRTISVNVNLETSIPGVFAVGDIRAGGMGRIGAAVGDGQIAVKNVFDYFDKQRHRSPRAAEEKRISKKPRSKRWELLIDRAFALDKANPLFGLTVEDDEQNTVASTKHP